jgi:hypothetical protein
MQSRSGAPLLSIERLLLVLACLVMAFAVIAGFTEPVLAMFRIIPNDYNEGWNAFWADVAMHGGALYPAPDSAIANNYPPLSFFIVGAVGRLVGDNLLAGRLVALVSLVIVTMHIYCWLRITSSSRGFGLLGAALFVAWFVAWAPDYIATDDPQMLAHALMLTGLFVLWRGNFRTASIVAASILMLCAGFTKHLLIPLPLVTTIWLAMKSRRQFVVWILACTATALFLCGAVYTVYGSAFFSGLLSERLYSRHRALIRARQVIELCWPAIVLMAVVVVGMWRSPKTARLADRAGFAVLYAIVAAMLGTLSAGGAGVDTNAFFDFLIASSLCAVLGLEALKSFAADRLSPEQLRTVAICTLAILIVPLTWRVRYRLVAEEHSLQTLQSREADAREDIRLIKTLGGGHAACETLSLCYWANTDFEVDFFMYGQKLETGALPASSCQVVFLAPRIRLVQIEKTKGALVSKRLPAACNEILHRYYRVLRDSESGVLLARNGA